MADDKDIFNLNGEDLDAALLAAIDETDAEEAKAKIDKAEADKVRAQKSREQALKQQANQISQNNVNEQIRKGGTKCFMVAEDIECTEEGIVAVGGKVFGVLNKEMILYVYRPDGKVLITKATLINTTNDKGEEELVDEASMRDIMLGFQIDLKKVGLDSSNAVPKFSVISNVPPTTKDNKKQVENPALMGMTLKYKEYAQDKDYMKILITHLMNARLVLPAKETLMTDVTGKRKIQLVTIHRKDDPNNIALPVFTDFSTLVSWKDMFANGKKPSVAVMSFREVAKYVQTRNCDLVINAFGPVGVGVPGKLIDLVASASNK